MAKTGLDVVTIGLERVGVKDAYCLLGNCTLISRYITSRYCRVLLEEEEDVKEGEE